MKFLSTALMLVMGLSATAASAQGLECTTQSHVIDFLSVEGDSAIIHHMSEQTDALKIISSSEGKIVAVKDGALAGAGSATGIVLTYNSKSGDGHLALGGLVVGVNCKAK